MTMTDSFQEKFPSVGFLCNGKPKRKEGEYCELCGNDHTMSFEFFRVALTDNCLDKAVVRAAINKLFPNDQTISFEYGKHPRVWLFEELGLGEEERK